MTEPNTKTNTENISLLTNRIESLEYIIEEIVRVFDKSVTDNQYIIEELISNQKKIVNKL